MSILARRQAEGEMPQQIALRKRLRLAAGKTGKFKQQRREFSIDFFIGPDIPVTELKVCQSINRRSARLPPRRSFGSESGRLLLTINPKNSCPGAAPKFAL